MKGKLIRTERLTLRNWSGKDRDDFLRLAEDPMISTWTGRTVPANELFEYYLQTGTAFAVIFEGKIIGNISLFSNSLTRGIRKLSVLECAFYILPQFHGHGLGTEALGALLGYARTDLWTDAVICGSFSDNEQSLNFIRKNGGVYIFSRTLRSGKTEEFYLFV